MAKQFGEKRIVEEIDKRKITGERLKKPVSLFKFIYPYKWYFIFGSIFLFLSSSTMLIFPYFMGKLIDAALGKSAEIFSINTITLLLLVVLVFQSIFSFLRIYFFTKVSEYTMSDIRKSLYNRLVYLPMTFFEKNRVGEITSRISADVSQLSDVLSFTLAEFFRGLSVLFVGSGILLYISPKLTAFMLLTFPFIVLSAMFFGKSIRKQSKKTQEELAITNVIVEETLQNIQAVKTFTNEKFESNRYASSLDNVIKSALKTARNRGGFISFIIFAVFGGIVLVMWYGAGLVAQNQLSVGDLTSFILYTSFIGASVAGLGDVYSQLQKTVGASERISELLEEQLESKTNSESKNVVFSGKINFEEVEFYYPARQEIMVLKSLSFEILPGQKVAFVGQSGAGKSTISQLLLRFHSHNKGKITIDNKDINAIEILDLRTNIGLVPQEIMLFGGTIKENIAYGKIDATDQEIIDAAQQANAMEFIERFPDGMQTLVGERGIKLSGGQRQRIAIARAILKNPPILILDEATSSLDTASEKVVQDALNNLMQNRTTIIIAHRLSTIQNADKILVLNNGEIVEEGTHTELAQKQNGLYKSLLEAQESVFAVQY